MATVLIVDDRPANREFLMTLLGYAGHRPLEADNGPDGLRIARAEKPDLAIVDILMPGMDGFQFVQELRGDPAIRQTRIVFWSATYREAEALALARRCGVTRLISKPSEPEQILRIVAEVLGENAEPAAALSPGEFQQDHQSLLTTKVFEKEVALEQVSTKLERLGVRYELILNAISEGIYGFDLECRTTFLNPAAARMLGYSVNEILGKPQHELIHHTRPDGVPYAREECKICRTFREGVASHVDDEVFWRKNGTSFPVEYTSCPIIEGDQITGGVVAFRDISDRIRIEAERHQAEVKLRELNAHLEERVAERTGQLEVVNRSLATAMGQAEQANRAKSEFLSRMSHELRTPLNGVLGFGQRLAKSELSQRDHERVQQIIRAGGHLLDLINEILDLSRIEAGRLSITPESVAVAAALDEAVGLVRPLAQQQGIQLTIQTPPRDAFVQADKQRLKQVLLNLLSNGIKYNRAHGSVTLFCSETAAGRMVIGVRDTGAGIRADKLAHLFEPFNRLGAEASGIEGTGLGLALSKGLVEAMGGAIQVRSEPGMGTTFLVELERGSGASPSRLRRSTVISTARAPSEPRTILYIEDNLANFNLVEDILRERPAVRLLSAMQGGLGLDLARQHHPDLILLDVHLPDMMGDEFMRRLSADPAVTTTPVVVLSADATSRQIDHLHALGVREYLTKPLDEVELLRVVDGILYARGTA